MPNSTYSLTNIARSSSTSASSFATLALSAEISSTVTLPDEVTDAAADIQHYQDFRFGSFDNRIAAALLVATGNQRIKCQRVTVRHCAQLSARTRVSRRERKGSVVVII